MFAKIKALLGDDGEEKAPEWSATVREGRARAPDGTGIYYLVLGTGEKTLLIANGLGGRLYAWEGFVDAFWRDYRIITWDYRGLFESDSPASRRRLAVVHHAEDAKCILDAEKVDRAVLCGWSMGVQVVLDVAASHPDLVAGLVLLNGTYGHALSTGLQPLFSIRWLPKRIHFLVEWLQDHPNTADFLARYARHIEIPVALVFGLTAGPQILKHRRILQHYFGDVLGPSFRNYLRLFQELDGHSAYHLLRDIAVPTLIVSGKLDLMTPAYQSKEMAARMPNSEHLALTLATHFALVERPEKVIPAIRRFLLQRASF